MRLLVATIVLLAACAPAESTASGPAGDEERGGPLVVAAVNYPLAYFAERIGGDLVRVELPSLEGDPAFWHPPPETIVGFQQADLILRNGFGYAGWIGWASLPLSRMVDTLAACNDSLIVLDGEITHTHGPGGKGDHGDTAFTTWLDPTLAIEQARAIQQALGRALPEQGAELQARFATLESELVAFDRRLQAVVARAPDRPLFGSHPVYQYLSRRYGLNLVSFHWEPDAFPDDAMWRDFERTLAEHPARWMLWEAEPSAETVERLRALGVESFVFDPCGNRPEHGDYAEVMGRNAAALDRIFADA